MNAHHVEARLAIDLGCDHRVVGCRVREGASEITRAVVEIAAADDPDFDAIRAAETTLDIDVGDVTRRFTLVVTGARFLRMEARARRYEIELRPRLFLLGHTKDTRKFRDLPAHEIVSRVLRERGVPFELRTERPTAARPYTAQYAESCLAFVSRLMEHEGQYYAFEQDGTMIIADRSSAAPFVDGPGQHPGLRPAEPGYAPGPSSRFDLLDAAGAMDRGERGVLAIERVARVAPGQVTVRDFDWKTPRADLSASCAADRDQELSIYDYPAGYRDRAEGERIARLRLEAERASARRIEGVSDVASFAAGRCFALGGAAGPAFEGDHFIVSAEHVAENLGGDSQSDKATYHNRFTAIPRGVPHRPKLSTPRPAVAGVHTAMVRGPAGEEIHTDQHGRAKVQFHWDREAKGTDEDSRWIRMLQEPSTSMALARVGWEVGVAYIDGDPDRPVGVSRHINGAMPPAYAQPTNKNAMTIKTPSSPKTGGYSEVGLDDTKEAMLFSLQAEKDMSAAVGRNKGETIGNDERRFVGNDATERVGGDQKVTVGRDATETVDGDRHVAIDGNRKKTVTGKESVEVGGDISVATAENETERVGLARITIAAGLTLPDVLGRAKRAISGLVPEPGAAVDAVVGGARGGAALGAKAGAQAAFAGAGGLGALGASAGAGIAGGIGGAVSGAMGGIQQGLMGMIPNPKAIASQITGGLSDGITLEKIADQVLTGSIARNAEKRMSRTIGGAFVGVAVKDISASAGKVYLETIGGAKISKVDGSISETVDGVLTITAGGSIVRTCDADLIVSSETSRVSAGAAIAIDAGGEILISGEEVEIKALATCSLAGGGVTIGATAGQVAFGGDMLIDAKGSVDVRSNPYMMVGGG